MPSVKSPEYVAGVCSEVVTELHKGSMMPPVRVQQAWMVLVSAEENTAIVLRIFDLFSRENPETTGR